MTPAEMGVGGPKGKKKLKKRYSPVVGIGKGKGIVKGERASC